jgi:uncharacterized metal-binding protein
MPAGRVHAADSISTAALIGAGGYFMDPKIVSTIDVVLLTFGVLSGILLSPDLDVDKGYIGLWFLRKIPFVGWFISGAWRLFWWPYAVLVPHRSWISHFPVISTIIRVVIIVSTFVVFEYVLFKSYLPLHFHYMLVWFLGLTISDTKHFVLDKFYPDQDQNLYRN